MVGGGELKVATVEVESVDNMATLPVSRAAHTDSTIERNNVANKEMELKNVQPKPSKRTSLFIIMSFIYAKLLVVICIAYVISDGITHNLPLYYYEGFFTYLYGMSIFFLLYVFCFLLPDFGCCYVDSEKKPPKEKKVKPPKEEKKKKEEKKPKENKKDAKGKDGKEKEKDAKKEKEHDKKKKHHQLQLEVYPRKMRDIVRLKMQEQDLSNNIYNSSNHNNTPYEYNNFATIHSPHFINYPESESANLVRRGHHHKQKNTYRRNTEFDIVDCNVNNVTTTDSDNDTTTPLVGPSELDNNKVVHSSSNEQDIHLHPQDNVDLESQAVVATAQPAMQRPMRKRKTTTSDNAHGSFFLRIGAIAFGLGTMIYNGLELGTEFEVPMTSPCYEILRVVNPILQMLFTFMQMYFIFLNSRVNILRFKVIARFGLMHICATNICVWIRTLVLEYLKEITNYHRTHPANPNDGLFAESIRQHTLLNAGKILGTERHGYNAAAGYSMDQPMLGKMEMPSTSTISTTTSLTRTLRSTARSLVAMAAHAYQQTTSTVSPLIPLSSKRTPYTPQTTIKTNLYHRLSTPSITTTTTTQFPTTTSTTPATTTFQTFPTIPKVISKIFTTTTNAPEIRTSPSTPSSFASQWAPTVDTAVKNTFNNIYNNVQPSFKGIFESTQNDSFNYLVPAGLTQFRNSTGIAAVNKSLTSSVLNSTDCGRTNIMGNFVQDSTPYLYPFIIEYSLIGAAVIYVMWKNIGRNPRYVSEEDLEHRLEVMLSRRAVAMAHAQHGRVDCVGASKGLFFGLLLLVGALICLILFFVLIHHPQLGLLAIYLADVSHCALMILSIFAIIIGFIRATKLRSVYAYRVQQLKFRAEDQSDLNDILLRVSAFGLFIYAVFSVIAGSLNALTSEPNLLVMVTGILSIVQVVLQLLFVADVARRRVHLPEHDRSKPGRQIVTFLLICNVTMWIIYTFEMQKVESNPVQLDFYGFATWAIIQRITLPLCIFHRFHSAVTLAEIWKTSYKARLE